jgi:hypothetical protein
MASGGGARLPKQPKVKEPETWSAYICPFLQEVAHRQGGGAPRSLQQIFPKSNKRPVNLGEFERLVSKYVSTLTPPSITAALQRALPANSAYRARKASRNTAVQQLIKDGVNTLAGLMTACRGHPAPPLQEALVDGGGEGIALERLFQSIFAAEYNPGIEINSSSGPSTVIENSLHNEQLRRKEEEEMEAVLAESLRSASAAGPAAAGGGGGSAGNSNVEIVEDGSWACKACTFQNPETYKACNMCGSAKQRKTRKRRGRKQMRSRRQRGGAKQIQKKLLYKM